MEEKCSQSWYLWRAKKALKISVMGREGEGRRGDVRDVYGSLGWVCFARRRVVNVFCIIVLPIRVGVSIGIIPAAPLPLAFPPRPSAFPIVQPIFKSPRARERRRMRGVRRKRMSMRLRVGMGGRM
jgi:hypothetical protein